MIRWGQSECKPGLSPGDVLLSCVRKSCLLSLTLSTFHLPLLGTSWPHFTGFPGQVTEASWKGACAQGAEQHSFSITPLLFSLWPFFLPLSPFVSSWLMTLWNIDWVAPLTCPFSSVSCPWTAPLECPFTAQTPSGQHKPCSPVQTCGLSYS